jgi:hypothetical protein
MGRETDGEFHVRRRGGLWGTVPSRSLAAAFVSKCSLNSLMSRVAGRLAFPALLLGLRSLPTGTLEAYRVTTSRSANRDEMPTSVALATPAGASLPFDAPRGLTFRRNEPLTMSIHLSSTFSAPPSTSHWRVHSQRPRPPSDRWCQPSVPVPPLWFLTTSAAFSAPVLAGLLHPAADHGVRRVSPAPTPEPKLGVWTHLPATPGTLRRVPLR